MKKGFVILLLFCFCVVVLRSQTQNTIPKSYEFTGPLYKAWQDIHDTWRTVEYPKILKENKLKMSCNKCESIYMDVIFFIDVAGRLDHYTVIKSNKCGKEFSKKLITRFMELFIDANFPIDMRNLKFEVHLGTGLKC